jgi:hypothetical protein
MPIFRDRVKEVSVVAAGTGNVTLPNSAATGGYQKFSTAFANNEVFFYCIVDSTNNLWEVGQGYITSSTVMVRDKVYDGSSGLNTAVNFTAQPLDVFCTFSAHVAEEAGTGAQIGISRGGAMP